MRILIVGITALSLVMAAPGARAQQPSVRGRWLSENGKGVIDIYPCIASLLFALSTIAVILMSAAPSRAQQSPVFGQWLTETRRGGVEVFPCAGKVCGKLVWLIEPIRRGAPAVDDLNPKPELRTRPL